MHGTTRTSALGCNERPYSTYLRLWRRLSGFRRPIRRFPAHFGHLSRTLNFLHSGHWNDLRGTEGIASEPHRRLTGKLQLPLDLQEARLLAQRVEQRVDLQSLQVSVS